MMRVYVLQRQYPTALNVLVDVIYTHVLLS